MLFYYYCSLIEGCRRLINAVVGRFNKRRVSLDIAVVVVVGVGAGAIREMSDRRVRVGCDCSSAKCRLF